ncbi:hypothetical protein B0H19DRAFT_1251942 [Mycena capillaripes]|nr:hypothetical protein B0H19DRAFT_1251942 [Mycena capillaripes]
MAPGIADIQGSPHEHDVIHVKELGVSSTLSAFFLPSFPLNLPFCSRFQARFVDPVGAFALCPSPKPDAHIPNIKTHLRELVLSTQYASEPLGGLQERDAALSAAGLLGYSLARITRLTPTSALFTHPTLPVAAGPASLQPFPFAAPTPRTRWAEASRSEVLGYATGVEAVDMYEGLGGHELLKIADFGLAFTMVRCIDLAKLLVGTAKWDACSSRQ